VPPFDCSSPRPLPLAAVDLRRRRLSVRSTCGEPAPSSQLTSWSRSLPRRRLATRRLCARVNCEPATSSLWTSSASRRLSRGRLCVPVDLRAVDFRRSTFFLRAVDFRAVLFRAVDFLAVDFLHRPFRVPVDAWQRSSYRMSPGQLISWRPMLQPPSASQDAIRFTRRRSRSLIPPHTP